MQLTETQRHYWQKNLRITGILLAIWFVVTFVVGYWARDLNFNFFGWPFSFWVGAQGALVVYVLISLVGYFMTSIWQFFLLSFMVATVQGGSQALSRSLFATMIPKHKSSEFFGFFGVFEKFAGIMGPLLFAATVRMTGSSRNAILSVIAFFVVGAVLLAFVDVEEGQRAVSGQPEPSA